MPRTLPWLKDQDASKIKASAPLPAKRLRPPSPKSDSGDDARSAQGLRARQRREAAQRAGRTPSTSPPPAPPSIEYLHEGLSHDDIYIMVEDEFLATAQLFTSHLHHAEYVRLKNAAKARSGLLGSTARHTDSITAMRAETMKKKQAEARAGKNKLALEEMKENARGNIAGNDDHTDEEEEESDAERAPWVGTSLQGLMAPDARKQNLTSLSGLHGIKSSTRAAKGYSKPDDSQQSPRQRDSCPGSRNVTSEPSTKAQVSQHHKQKDVHPSNSKGRLPSKRLSDISSTSSSDDLDAPIKRHALPKPTNLYHTSTKLKPTPAARHNPLTLAAEDLFPSTQSSLPKPLPSETTRPISPPPRPDPVISSPPSEDEAAAALRRRIQARRERMAAMEAKRKVGAGGGGGRNVDVNEIPVFLV
ncbi:MAG: hypothetical protein LQ343_003262 [Gyalolechia ehrenbergii]|nr:MAG: hypothetical protein LQ343_003262 [Gyalolechia ehrenbergii]